MARPDCAFCQGRRWVGEPGRPQECVCAWAARPRGADFTTHGIQVGDEIQVNGQVGVVTDVRGTRLRMEPVSLTHVLEDRGTHLESRPVRNDGPVRRVPTQANRRTRFEREEVMGMQVIINGEEREVDSVTLPYESVVAMAGMKGWPSVTYKGRGPEGRSGILTPGGEVTLTPGMVFNVCHTGNA